MEIEQLLNKLIKKGWRPFNKDIREFFTLNEFTCGYRGEGTNHLGTIRDIVSKESGLWQFVCENEMIKIEYGKIREKYDETVPTTDKNKAITYRQLLGEDNYEYRLIESSLKDESELEDFLLNSIKLD